jgi:transposase
MKLKDLSLSARVHQRYRMINEVRQGRGIVEAADRVGCHFTVAYDWVRRFNRT